MVQDVMGLKAISMGVLTLGAFWAIVALGLMLVSALFTVLWPFIRYGLGLLWIAGKIYAIALIGVLVYTFSTGNTRPLVMMTLYPFAKFVLDIFPSFMIRLFGG